MRISDINKLPSYIPKIVSGIEGFSYKDANLHSSVFISDTIPLTTLMSDYLRKFRFSKKFTRNVYLEKYVRAGKLRYVRNFAKLRSALLKSQAILTMDQKEANCLDITLENITFRKAFGPIQAFKKMGSAYAGNDFLHNKEIDVFWILTNPNLDGRDDVEEIDINHLSIMMNRVHKEHPLNPENKNINTIHLLVPFDAEKDEMSVDLNFLICKVFTKGDTINYSRLHAVIQKMFNTAESLSGKKLFTVHHSSVDKDAKIDDTFDIEGKEDEQKDDKFIPPVDKSIKLQKKSLETKDKSQVQTTTADLLKETYMKELYKEEIKNMMESSIKNFNPSVEVKKHTIEDANDGMTEQERHTFEVFDNETNKSRKISLLIPKVVDGKFFKIYGKKYILANQIYSNLVSKIKEDIVAFTSSHTKTLIYIQGKSDDRIGRYLSKNSGTSLKCTHPYVINENKDVPSSLHAIFKSQTIFKYKDYIISYDLYLANFPDIGSNDDPLLHKICIGLKKELYPTLEIAKNKDSLYNYLKNLYTKHGSDVFLFFNKFKDSINNKPFLIEIKNEYGKDDANIRRMTVPGIGQYARMNIGGKKVAVIMIMLLAYYNDNPNGKLSDFFKKYFDDAVYADISESSLSVDNVIDMKLSNGYINIHIYDSLVGAELLFSVLRKLDVSMYSIEDMKEGSDIFYILVAYFNNTKYQPEAAISSLSFNINSIIDPVTKSMIESSDYVYHIIDKKHYPRDFIEILYYSVYLLNDRSYKPGSDFSGYRVRNMETIPAIIYKLVSESAHEAKKQSESKLRGRKRMVDSIDLHENSVLEEFRNLTTFESFSDINLSAEIGLMSKITYKGFAGLNNNRSVSSELRQGDESAIGFIDVCNNVDNANVGSNRFMPLNPNIENVRGTGSIVKNLREKVMNNEVLTDEETTSLLSFDTYNEPFLAAHADAPRISMASIQARHGITLDNYDDMPIKTGVEDTVKEIASSTYVIRAPKDLDSYKVFKINEDKKEIILKSGTKLFNVSYDDKVVNNSGGGFSILKEYSPCVKVGDTVKKGKPVALDKGSFKNGNYTNAKLLRCSFIHYGETLEDGAIISASAAKELLFNYVTEKTILIREDQTIIRMIDKVGTKIDVGTPLLVFAKDDKSDDIFNIFGDLNKSIEEDELELNTYIKSKYPGTIVDITIKYNGTIRKMPALQKAIKSLPKEKLIEIKTNKIEGEIANNAIVVTYAILSKAPALTGSKSTNQSTKSVFKVMRDEDMPYTLDGKRIDYIMSTLSIITRMTINNFLALYTNKCIFALRDYLKNNISKARNILKDVYKIVYVRDENTHKTELEKLNSLSDKELKQLVLENKIYIYVKPFKEPTLDDIKKFADYLKIDLDEKLVLPSLGNAVTERPVPVGFAPVKLLEQIVFKKTVTSHDVAATDPITGQATSTTKTRMATSPELLNSFSYDGLTESVFPELLYARSDDRDANMDMQKQIAETGRFSTAKMSTTGIGQVQKTLHYYLIGSGIGNDIMSDTEVSVDGQKMDTRKNN